MQTKRYVFICVNVCIFCQLSKYIYNAMVRTPYLMHVHASIQPKQSKHSHNKCWIDAVSAHQRVIQRSRHLLYNQSICKVLTTQYCISISVTIQQLVTQSNCRRRVQLHICSTEHYNITLLLDFRSLKQNEATILSTSVFESTSHV